MNTFSGAEDRLDADQVVATIQQLLNRIKERFPEAALIHSCRSLLSLSQEAKFRASWISRPMYLLRLAVAILITLMLSGVAGALMQFNTSNKPLDLILLMNFMEAGINNAVLLAAAIYFLVTIETRVKRRRLLVAIHELRSLAHVIDMHQLTKDPDRVLFKGVNTKSSPVVVMGVYEMSRYLDYCIEMLSLTGKIAATYGLFWRDEISIQAVNDLERLTTGLSQKIFQKLMILHGNDGASCTVSPQQPGFQQPSGLGWQAQLGD